MCTIIVHSPCTAHIPVVTGPERPGQSLPLLGPRPVCALESVLCDGEFPLKIRTIKGDAIYNGQ